MKRIINLLFVLFMFSTIYSQWTQVNTGLPGLNVTSFSAFQDTITVSIYGQGIFRSTNNGDSWSDVSGNLTNTNVKRIWTAVSSRMLFVSTDNGIYLTYDLSNYVSTGNGLTFTDVNYYAFGDTDKEETEWSVGTNGGGIFAASDLDGSWTAMNNGLSGDALFVNNISGYDDDDVHYVAISTKAGMYYSTDTMVTWVNGSTKLSGDQVVTNELMCLGSAIIVATNNGLHITADFGENWYDFLAMEKLNITGGNMSTPLGVFYYTMGNKIFISFDMFNWSEVDKTGVSGGEIVAAAFNSQYAFVGTESGGVFRQQLTSITDAETEEEVPLEFRLGQNYPNPFNPVTIIKYSVPKSSQVKLSVYNLLGQEIASLVNEQQAAGIYSVKFDGSNITSGVYLYKLTAGDFSEVKKLTLIK